MINYIEEKLRELIAIDSPSGYTKAVSDYAMGELEKIGFAPWVTQQGSVLASLGGEGHPLILSAHIDTLGAMVAEVKKNGRLRITPIGGLNANNVETENCRVVTFDGAVYSGCAQLRDPSIHVNGKYSETARTFDEIEVVLDEAVCTGEETAALGVFPGCFVCFEPRLVVTPSGFIKSRFLDDKLSAAILLGYAKHIKEAGLTPRRKVYVCLTVYEEVGHGATAGLPEDAVEILGVDMGCVGEGLKCTERQVSICAKDTRGPSNYEILCELISLAKAGGIDYAVDVYPHYASDCDTAVAAGYDLKHCLIGAGVYASHGYERSHLEGVRNTLELIKAYTL
ncbi:MAG TPA: M42 family metallopeptidase [Candidatus Acidoferrum sp.]|nr:M42 family metallopeptidase [Candidatus Acidoferrum sp.]